MEVRPRPIIWLVVFLCLPLSQVRVCAQSAPLASDDVNVTDLYAQNGLDSYADYSQPSSRQKFWYSWFDLTPYSEDNSPYSGALLERSKLTGNWWGSRDTLRDNGVTFNLSTTQYYQGVASGGLEQSFPYGGRNDYFMYLDGEKLGLWQGFYVKVRGETRYGESANFNTGALSPVNEYLLVPASEGVVSGLTAVTFSQYLTESTQVYVGKINLLDGIRQPLTGATGLEGFMNTSLIFNTILGRTLPYSAFGGGVAYAREDGPVLTLNFYDTRSAATTSVFNDLFNNGVVIFATAVMPTSFLGMPGHQGIDGVYSSGQYTNIDRSQYLDPLTGLVIPSPKQTGSWALSYVFDQALWVSPDDPHRVWGMFGSLGLADDNPSPLRWTCMAGISGASPFSNMDTFGVGFFYLGVSDVLKGSADPLTPLRNEQGVELYYNYRLTPWCQLTPDLQFIWPFDQRTDTAVTLGLRAKVDF